MPSSLGDPEHQDNLKEGTGWGTTRFPPYPISAGFRPPQQSRSPISPRILVAPQFQFPLLAPAGYPPPLYLCLCGAFPFTCPEFRNLTTLPATQSRGLGEAGVSLPCFPSKGLLAPRSCNTACPAQGTEGRKNRDQQRGARGNRVQTLNVFLIHNQVFQFWSAFSFPVSFLATEREISVYLI